MKKENQSQSKRITRRKFLKTSLAFSAASAMSFSLPTLARSKPADFTIQGFVDPYGVAVGSNGRIFVTDAAGYCLKIFDESGALLKTVGSAGSGEGQFNYPQGVAVDGQNGDVYVVDSNNGRVVILDGDGSFKNKFGTVGGYPDAFYTPKGIFIKDKIYACNTRSHALAIYDKSSFKLTGYFGDLGDDPKVIAKGSVDYRFRIVTDVAVANNGNIYVVDSKHGQVKVLSPDGGFLFKFAENGSGEGQLNFPEGIAIDNEQNVYVCDALNGRILKFSAEGNFLGLRNENMKKPVSMCIDQNSRIYVSDSELKQVNVFTWNS